MNGQSITATTRLHGRMGLDIARAHVRHLTDLRGQPRPAHRMVANSLPKSGTHLLLKALESLGTLERVRLHISPGLRRQWPARAGDVSVPVGVASPVGLSQEKLRQALSRLPAGTFVTGHLPHSPVLAELLRKVDARMVVLIRDPRDVALSSARYLEGKPDHRLGAAIGEQGFEDRLTTSILGSDPRLEHPLLDIRTRMLSVLAWGNEPGCLLVRFESLVGPHGGGTRAAQLGALRRVANHAGVDVPESRLEAVADGLFGGTATFRRGQIGGWRDAYTPEHVEAAKPLLADLLIELGYEESATWHLGPD